MGFALSWIFIPARAQPVDQRVDAIEIHLPTNEVTHPRLSDAEEAKTSFLGGILRETGFARRNVPKVTP